MLISVRITSQFASTLLMNMTIIIKRRAYVYLNQRPIFHIINYIHAYVFEESSCIKEHQLVGRLNFSFNV